MLCVGLPLVDLELSQITSTLRASADLIIRVMTFEDLALGELYPKPGVPAMHAGTTTRVWLNQKGVMACLCPLQCFPQGPALLSLTQTIMQQIQSSSSRWTVDHCRVSRLVTRSTFR